MAGISSKAAGGTENRKKYNSIEFTEDLDLDMYDAFYRNLDPQIGKWWQIDPKVDAGYESISPYASMYDDPVRYSDLLGDEADELDGGGCPTCPVINPSTVGKFADAIVKVNNALFEGFSKFSLTPGGVLNGGLNVITSGIWPTNPAETFTGTNTLSADQQQSYDASVTVGQVGTVVYTLGGGSEPGR